MVTEKKRTLHGEEHVRRNEQFVAAPKKKEDKAVEAVVKKTREGRWESPRTAKEESSPRREHHVGKKSKTRRRRKKRPTYSSYFVKGKSRKKRDPRQEKGKLTEGREGIGAADHRRGRKKKDTICAAKEGPFYGNTEQEGEKGPHR